MIWSPIPTTDLYFLNSSKDLVSSSPRHHQPIRRLGANTFQCNNRFLLIRRDQTQILKQILNHENAEIFYLLDDDIWAASEDSTLPERYRQKLACISSDLLGEAIKETTRFIIPSEALSEKLPAKIPVSILTPSWHAMPPNAEHFKQYVIKLVHLGTNSHLAGYDFLKPILEYVLENTGNVTFTYHSNTPLLGTLDKHSRVIRRRLMRWKKYKNQIGKERFHLGLYPILDTPFNQGRSHNKILEYSLTGCAALYSSSWNHIHLIKHGANGWLCMNDQQSWVDNILALIAEPDRLREGFKGASQLFYQLNDLQAQREFWKQLLLKD